MSLHKHFLKKRPIFDDAFCCGLEAENWMIFPTPHRFTFHTTSSGRWWVIKTTGQKYFEENNQSNKPSLKARKRWRSLCLITQFWGKQLTMTLLTLKRFACFGAHKALPVHYVRAHTTLSHHAHIPYHKNASEFDRYTNPQILKKDEYWRWISSTLLDIYERRMYFCEPLVNRFRLMKICKLLHSTIPFYNFLFILRLHYCWYIFSTAFKKI